LLVQAKYVLPVAGIFIWLLEMAFPLLIWGKRTRAAAFGCILAMHIGIGAAMGMYLFATVMIVLNVAAFGPGFVWSCSNRQIRATENANVGLCPTDTDHSDLVST
jgi:hypothetical protein